MSDVMIYDLIMVARSVRSKAAIAMGYGLCSFAFFASNASIDLVMYDVTMSDLMIVARSVRREAAIAMGRGLCSFAFFA
jgi:hypothetical protein